MTAKTRKILIAVLVLALVFIALRVYGAYQQERQTALQEAAIAEQKAKKLNEEVERIVRQSECDNLWLKYETATIEKRIAKIAGSRGRNGEQA